MNPKHALQEQHPSSGNELIQSRPVFILGIAERSGTTYLQDLLRLHPDCGVDGLELEEDHFVTYSDLLLQFVQLASKDWKQWWGPEQLQKERELVCHCLGEGLTSYLRLQLRNRRALTRKVSVDSFVPVLVTKTPDTTNLHLFFRFFPDADLLILVRDGRSVVESAMKTFYRNFPDETRQWATRAEQIDRFVNNSENQGKRYVIVRYEDLYTNTEAELRRLMAFLRLNPDAYDFAAARNLAVRGSSTLRHEGAEWQQSFVAPGIHWNAVPKTSDFRPLERWSEWTRAQHERFNWIAGRQLGMFGYQMRQYRRRAWFWKTWNIVLDLLPIEKTMHIIRKIRREIRFASAKPGTLKLLWQKMCHIVTPERRYEKRQNIPTVR